jgi:hypothetical protein
MPNLMKNWRFMKKIKESEKAKLAKYEKEKRSVCMFNSRWNIKLP